MNDSGVLDTSIYTASGLSVTLRLDCQLHCVWIVKCKWTPPFTLRLDCVNRLYQTLKLVPFLYNSCRHGLRMWLPHLNTGFLAWGCLPNTGGFLTKYRVLAKHRRDSY
jgi:hypothetical protein